MCSSDLATLAEGGRITQAQVEAETARLRWLWSRQGQAPESGSESAPAAADWPARLLGPEKAAALDLFDRLQLAAVLPVCVQSASLSEVGRWLFAQSRQQRKAVNDSDRLRKYLLRFGLSWEQIRQGMTSGVKP